MLYATPVRWMDYYRYVIVLTNTDLDRIVNNIWEKWVLCVHRKSLKVQLIKKCCVYIFDKYSSNVKAQGDHLL